MNLTIVFGIVLFIVTIFIIKKQYNLESYTYLHNINFGDKNQQTPIEILSQPYVSSIDTCDILCNIHNNNHTDGCSGYSSNIPNNIKKRPGYCNFYRKDVLNANNLQKMKIDNSSTSFLYIK